MKKILIIDDDPDILELLLAFLAIEGFDATGVPNRDEANALLNKKGFDVILMDYFMPGLSSGEFLRELRKDHPSSSIVLVTAAPRINRLAENLGIARWVSKPIDLDELLRMIQLE